MTKKVHSASPFVGLVEDGLREFVPESEFSQSCLDLKNTPRRIRHAFEQMLGGYAEERTLKFTVFRRDTKHEKQMLIQRGISFTSLCAHHLLPFRGTAVVGYLPDQTEVGLSKLARVVDMFAKRLQTQERMGDAVADFLMDHPKLKPNGVGVLLEAEHMCMTCRGVQKAGATTRTSSLRGLFLTSPQVRAEFLSLGT